MRKRVVLVVCDSLRRDMIDAVTAPALEALRAKSANFANARGVFPSVTRVSAASVATGCYPLKHGLLGSNMVLDEGGRLSCYSVGDPDFKDRLKSVTGQTLRCPTLPELLKDRGGVVCYSNVSAGAAYFLDPDHNGFVYHRAGSFGPGGKPVPRSETLTIECGADGDAEMTDHFCKDVLRERNSALSILWLSEPDCTGHSHPLGSPEHLAAIGSADRCVRRVLRTLDRIDPTGENILRIVCSDHGMESVAQEIDLIACLVEAGFKASRESQEIVVAPSGNAASVHFATQAIERLDKVKTFLERQDWVADVFVGTALREVGFAEETRSCLVLSLRHDDEPNAYGISGHSDMVADPLDPGAYVSMHGGLGRGDQQPFLFLSGDGISAGVRQDDVSLVDLAPTVLHFLDAPGDNMDGKSLLPLAKAARELENTAGRKI